MVLFEFDNCVSEETPSGAGVIKSLEFDGWVPEAARSGDGATASLDWPPGVGRFLDGGSMEGDAAVSFDCDDVVSPVGSMGSRGGVDKDEEREGKGGG